MPTCSNSLTVFAANELVVWETISRLPKKRAVIQLYKSLKSSPINLTCRLWYMYEKHEYYNRNVTI